MRVAIELRLSTGRVVVSVESNFVLVPIVGDEVRVVDEFEGETYEFVVTKRVVEPAAVKIIGELT